MFVCICNAVTDQDIKKAVQEGAKSVYDLKEQLSLGTCCGCCIEIAEQYLEQCLSRLVFPTSPISSLNISSRGQRKRVSFW